MAFSAMASDERTSAAGVGAGATGLVAPAAPLAPVLPSSAACSEPAGAVAAALNTCKNQNEARAAAML